MFKKIEIWILYLVLVFTFISYIFFGALVLREHSGGYHIPIVSHLSKAALFLAEIPRNIKKINSQETKYPNKAIANRFIDRFGFIGAKNDDEKYLLLSRYDGAIGQSIVELIDLRSFDIIHSWNPDIDSFNDKVNIKNYIEHEYIKRDANDARYRIIHPILIQDGSLIFQNGGPLFKIDKYSNLTWIKDDELYHHSIENDTDGNLWVCIRYSPTKIDSKYVGNDLNSGYRDDGIRKISSKGEFLYDKSVSELLIENNMEYLLFSNTDDFKKDPIHLNDIQAVEYDSEFWKKGDVFLSLRNVSKVILFRPSTNKIIWKSKDNYFFNQHDVDILDEKRISIFDNNSKFYFDSMRVENSNRVVIYNFETKEYSYHLNESMQKEDVRTVREGRSQILPNGDLIVEESNYGRILYFNNNGSLRWTYFNTSNKINYRLNWSRILYKEDDLKIVNNLMNKIKK